RQRAAAHALRRGLSGDARAAVRARAARDPRVDRTRDARARRWAVHRARRRLRGRRGQVLRVDPGRGGVAGRRRAGAGDGRVPGRRTGARNGALRRSHQSETAELPGTLDDHAYVADGLIALYEATGEPHWLDEAHRLTRLALELFYDPRERAFYLTAAHDPGL